MMQEIVRIAGAIGLAWSFAGCRSSDEGIFKGGSSESKPSSSVGSGLTESAEVLGTFKFALRITSNSEAAVCRGEIEATIKSDFTLDVPNGVAQCASIKIDLAKMLPKLTGGIDKIGGLSAGKGDKLIYLASIGAASFSPPRPLLLQPIVRKHEGLKDFDKTSTHTLTVKEASGQTTVKDGSFRVQVLGINQTEQIKDQTFDKVIHWKISRDGFDGITALNGLLFDSWEWWFNTNPIMIPRMRIKGNIKDFVEVSDESLKGVMGDTVILDMAVLDYKLN
jgi:hypothetical protein